MLVVSVVDDRREFGRNAVIQVSVSTARVDRYSVIGRWRARIRVEVQRTEVVGKTRGGQSAFYVLGDLVTGELASGEACEIPGSDPILGSRVLLGGMMVAESASVVRGERVDGLAEVLVEVVDVLGCEEPDGRVVVPGGRCFGIREGSGVGKEVMREQGVVKKRAGL
jgi:hypothetical protein